MNCRKAAPKILLIAIISAILIAPAWVLGQDRNSVEISCAVGGEPELNPEIRQVVPDAEVSFQAVGAGTCYPIDLYAETIPPPPPQPDNPIQGTLSGPPDHVDTLFPDIGIFRYKAVNRNEPAKRAWGAIIVSPGGVTYHEYSIEVGLGGRLVPVGVKGVGGNAPGQWLRGKVVGWRNTTASTVRIIFYDLSGTVFRFPTPIKFYDMAPGELYVDEFPTNCHLMGLRTVLRQDGEETQYLVPALTEWGMLALVVMLVLSALWLYRSKRKVRAVS